MASETTSADVQYLMEVAQCGRAVAISFLKVRRIGKLVGRPSADRLVQRYGAMEAAMNAYFEHNGKLPPEITVSRPHHRCLWEAKKEVDVGGDRYMGR